MMICPKCKQEHAIYSYDRPGEFPCACGQWLEYKADYEPDYDAMIKDEKIDKPSEREER